MADNYSYEMYEKSGSVFSKNYPEWGEDDSEGKAKALFNLIKNKKLDIKSVVEIGCGAGGVLASLQKLLPPDTILQGYDIAEDAIRLAIPKQNNKLTFYKENFLEKDVYVDLLIMADVFEHIEDYYGFLRRASLKANHFLFSIHLMFLCLLCYVPECWSGSRCIMGIFIIFRKNLLFWL